MKHITQSIIGSLLLLFITVGAFAQYEMRDALVKHDGIMVPSLTVEVDYENLPRLKYAWNNYVQKHLETVANSDNKLDNNGITTTSFTSTPTAFFTKFTMKDTLIQMNVYAELGNGYFLSPFENKKAYREMKQFTTDFLSTFTYKQKKQRLAELQLRVDYLQQELLKFQTESSERSKQLEELKVKMQDDAFLKKQLEADRKSFDKKIRQAQKALQKERKLLDKLLTLESGVPNTETIPKG